jgi:hypothetical protein
LLSVRFLVLCSDGRLASFSLFFFRDHLLLSRLVNLLIRFLLKQILGAKDQCISFLLLLRILNFRLVRPCVELPLESNFVSFQGDGQQLFLRSVLNILDTDIVNLLLFLSCI